ncbi:MAG: sulfurtransferase TusA family protein [Fimbriimonadales bacterium]|jgi:TusA-related sulfurtransferase|nr:sulfurtransferase TusA family protein [Armatimonadota bacterium]MCX7688017.1 sulfurtransferase TusA family protein [Fimbriimonadales bacterium]CUU02063.1 TusA-related sulfurtransferase [Armatimonadetes bacterium GBS]CUU35658.1 TusA-related sulfurtransferase [Armatimonadetes bacterium GXS]CUU38483.1 TusA-related sulfurtransferase [Armatimonadetes bacterium DC]GBC89637.1 Sulfurtransferase TusA [bacterium HR14]
MTQITYDVEVDARGLQCPMPIVNARKAFQNLQSGQVLRVLATDPGSVNDFQGWVKMVSDAELVSQETTEMDGKTVYVHYVRKK